MTQVPEGMDSFEKTNSSITVTYMRKMKEINKSRSKAVNQKKGLKLWKNHFVELLENKCPS